MTTLKAEGQVNEEVSGRLVAIGCRVNITAKGYFFKDVRWF